SHGLHANRSLSPDLARWSVESWAVALRVVAETQRLESFKFDSLVSLIERAVEEQSISDAALERLLNESRSRGIAAADARDYIAGYAAVRGWSIGTPRTRTAGSSPDSTRASDAVSHVQDQAPATPVRASEAETFGPASTTVPLNAGLWA